MKLVILCMSLVSTVTMGQCKSMNIEELTDLVLTLKSMVQSQQEVISDQEKIINELKVTYFSNSTSSRFYYFAIRNMNMK